MDVKPDPYSLEEQARQGHRMEHHWEWEYQKTWAFQGDHPDGWAGRDDPPAGEGWERNTEVGDLETPGYAVWEHAASGVMLVSYWRRLKADPYS